MITKTIKPCIMAIASMLGCWLGIGNNKTTINDTTPPDISESFKIAENTETKKGDENIHKKLENLADQKLLPTANIKTELKEDKRVTFTFPDGMSMKPKKVKKLRKNLYALENIPLNKKFNWSSPIGMERGALEVDDSQQLYGLANDDQIFHKIDHLSEEPIFSHVPMVEDIHQSDNEETCYLLSALASIVKNNPMKIYEMIKDCGNHAIVRIFDIEQNENGTKNFIPRYIKVPKVEFDFTRSSSWVEIIKMAYAKGGFNNKNYELFFNSCDDEERKAFMKDSDSMKKLNKAKSGSVSMTDIDLGFDDLTLMNLLGKDVEQIKIDKMEIRKPEKMSVSEWINRAYEQKEIEVFDKIKNAMDNNKPMCISFRDGKGTVMNCNHIYFISGYIDDGKHKFIYVSDPYKGVTANKLSVTGCGQNPIISGAMYSSCSHHVLCMPFYIEKSDGTLERKTIAGCEQCKIELNDFMHSADYVSIVAESVGTDKSRIFDKLFENADDIKNPITLRHFDEYQKNCLEKIRKELSFSENNKVYEEVKVVEKFLQDMINNSKVSFSLNAPPSAIRGIVNDNEIKNRFGVGSYSLAGADINDSERVEASERMFGCPYIPQRYRSYYEKYGFLTLSDISADRDIRASQINEHLKHEVYIPHNFNSRKSGVGCYGGVTIIFKKDKVKERTTMTFGDSAKSEIGGIASRVSDPKILGLLSKNDDKLNCLHLLYNAIISGELKTDDPIGVMKTCFTDCEGKFTSEYLAFSNYIELQFHGKITTQDIDKIVIDQKVVSKDWIEQLKIILDDNNINYQII